MKYYLTTPIYYVNAAPHIGHAYTTIAADTIKRFKTLQGHEAVLTTGTDEHGQKIERAARAAGKTPQEFTDIIAGEFREQWRALDLGIDRFQRTSSPQHHAVVQDLFLRCQQRGYVYKGSYTGQYCVFDELYANEAQPGDPCPLCGRPTETVTEENYFFRLSAFEESLLRLYQEQPQFIQPESRRNEVMAFVRQGLSDLSISRTSIQWGIPVPGDDKHVFYVWFDALTTYMSAVEGEDLWPADLHLIGKEIVRFHAIYWPAFLMAAGLPLPKRVFAHGWLLFEQDKMSKSRGNIVRATPIQQVMGVDALRYFLLREIVFGQDGNFSYDALVGRYNSDLAHGLGNLASRTLSMIHQYRDGYVPDAVSDSEIADVARETIARTIKTFHDFEFSRGLEAVWGLISAVDKYIVRQAPWALAKKQGDDAQAALESTLYTAAEALRIVCVLLWPAIPGSTRRIWRQLGMLQPIEAVRFEELTWGQLPAGQRVERVSAIFPRIDAQQAIPRMRELEIEETLRQAILLGKPAGSVPPPPAAEVTAERETPPPAPIAETITIDEFARVDLRVGVVLSAQPVKGADKLLHLQVDLGEPQPRSIVAGIAKAYAPESLVGRKVVIVANLAPRKLKGIESQGMIVAASVEGGWPVLATFAEDIPAGARLK
ncbi:MAG: methionine--tRNA ligase [Acidobacteria bacterium]|nr:methionine--tRNA ligase [Acidobacteriota bacterium]MBI3279270.1 methionine--tRNA ligase [Acidobacteriota bacterium]